jgi:hypothetical protein
VRRAPEALHRHVVRWAGTLPIALVGLSGLAVAACGVSFGAGTKRASTAGSEDVSMSQAHEEQNAEVEMLKASEAGNKSASPTFTVNLVVGGTPIDAGSLPKPPIPVVSVPAAL